MKIFFSALLILILSGCELLPTPASVSKPTNAADYYIWLQNISLDEMKNEAELENQKLELGEHESHLKLALIYAFRNSPVKNPHRARKHLKSYLNESAHETNEGALIFLLDQLNDNVKLQNKLSEVNDINKSAKEQLKLIAEQHAKLSEQLTKLTQIEQQISDRENR